MDWNLLQQIKSLTEAVDTTDRWIRQVILRYGGNITDVEDHDEGDINKNTIYATFPTGEKATTAVTNIEQLQNVTVVRPKQNGTSISIYW